MILVSVCIVMAQAPRDAFEAGDAAMRNSKLAVAEKKFLEVIAMTPGDVGAHANPGRDL